MKITRLKTPPKPRHALLRKLTDPQSGDTVDHGLILWFPGTRTTVMNFRIATTITARAYNKLALLFHG